MEKLLLVDGNSILFRAYYATKYGAVMTNKNGVATNAVYAFSNMLNKAVDTIKPDYILVAFDTGGKTFRHDMFDDYKGTRSEPDEALISQFELVREFLDASEINRLEILGFEADDIIGSMSTKFKNSGIEIDILTSDRDMLQLIDEHVNVVLMKKGFSEIKIMDIAALDEEMGITPKQIVDLKALMGDASDNIPGVPSVGEKTGLKLIKEYGNLDNLYEHADELKGKMGEKVRDNKEQAYLSYQLAEIKKDVDIDLNLDNIKYQVSIPKMNEFYRKYDMNSLIVEEVKNQQSETIRLEPFVSSFIKGKVSIVMDSDKSEIIKGCAIYADSHFSYLTYEEMKTNDAFKQLMIYPDVICTDTKILYKFCLEENISYTQMEDLILMAFIVDCSITTDAILKDKNDLWFFDYEYPMNLCMYAKKVEFVFDSYRETAIKDKCINVYETIEKPLSPILAKCEYYGFNVSKEILDEIAIETKGKLDILAEKIYALAGMEFNINSPKQLGEVLFDKLDIPTGRKRSTSVKVLEELQSEYEIAGLVLEYRKYQKLYSTYAIGLAKHIKNGKIHTHLNQHATQTGRLSSSDPNLQNISVRDEESRMIRKAFKASKGCQLLCIDYSQIELRVLAHLAKEQAMIDGFNKDEDIHYLTASKIFNTDEVTSLMRRQAKSVNFGIVYGISDFGLSKQLDISVSDAHKFITTYNEIYPEILVYMDEIKRLCEQDGYVTTFFGRRRYIPEIHSKNRAVKEFGKRAAMNAPIQGSAADIIKLAMIKADEILTKGNYKSKMILQVHDELIFDVYEDELEELRSKLVNVMETIVQWPVKLKVSYSIGKDWYE